MSPVRSPLVDGHGRQIGDLRVSVTDRCNLRCQYCMPAEGLSWLKRSEVLSFEEVERVVGLFAEMGVCEVRMTGGEPLARRDFPKLAAAVAAIPGVNDLALTTNGYLLERHAATLVAAGVRRFNVSLDALSPERFLEITRRDGLQAVLASLEELERFPEVERIKVNAVAIRGFTESEVIRFAALARRKPYQVRFIEFMPLDADRSWQPEAVLSGQEIRALIEPTFPLRELEREESATARVYRFADGKGEIGFINPISEPFCADCNRVRLTAEGKLRTCLFSLHETDLREPLRSGASDDQLVGLIRDAVWRKELKHQVGERGFRLPPRTMSQIGG